MAAVAADSAKSDDAPSCTSGTQAGNDFADRARGVLMGAFVGDALGAPVELLAGASIAEDPLFRARGVRAMVSQLDLESWRAQARAVGMTVGELAASNPTRPAGHYTDDTLLSFSLAEAIVGAGGTPPCNAQCAEAAVAAWRANEASPLKGLRGFGSGTQRVIEALADGSATPDLTGRMVRPEGSNRNGAVMRIAPLGLLFSDRALDDARHWSVLGELRAAVSDAVKFSHDNAEAVDGATSVAYLVARGAAATVASFDELHADAKQLLGFMARNVCTTESLKGMFASLAEQWRPLTSAAAPFHWECEEHAYDIAALKQAGVTFPGGGFTAVGAAATCAWMALRHGHRAEEALVRTIALGGDTDTLACIVGAVLGAAHGFAVAGNTYPQAWVDALENGPRGRDYALELADRLAQSVLLSRRQNAADEGVLQVTLSIPGGRTSVGDVDRYAVRPSALVSDFVRRVRIREGLTPEQLVYKQGVGSAVLDPCKTWAEQGCTRDGVVVCVGYKV